MGAPYTAENTIRKLDEAVFNWLGEFKVDYTVRDPLDQTKTLVNRPNHPLLRVFASPMRAFASMVDLLVAENLIDGDSAAIQRARADMDWPTLPLPVVSIERDDPIISNELANPSATFRRAYVDADGNTMSYGYPLHYLTQYRLTFWCEKQFTRAAFMEWIMSQLGRPGAAQSEMFLTVDHAEPWGKQIHQWHYTGSANMSDLEGDEARHLRQMVSFVLRSWMFRPAVDKAPPVYATQRDYYTGPVAGSEDGPYPDNGRWGTNNLFTLKGWTPVGIASSWPKTEFVAVSSADRGLSMAYGNVEASVPLASVESTPDAVGRSVWSVSLYAAATAATKLTVRQYNSDRSASHLCASIAIPTGENTLHRFTVVDDRWVRVESASDGAAGSVSLTKIDVRQLFEVPRISVANIEVVGATTIYTWTGLERRPYLIVGVLSPDNVGGIVRAESDALAPSSSNTETVSTATHRGFALLTMPDTDSLRLVTPASFTVDAVYVQTFDGPFSGSSL